MNEEVLFAQSSFINGLSLLVDKRVMNRFFLMRRKLLIGSYSVVSNFVFWRRHE